MTFPPVEELLLRSDRATHRIKSWPENFRAVAAGRKTFELRRDDRPTPYQCGDLLVLQEWNPPDRDGENPGYTGRQITMLIGRVDRGPCCPAGWCAFELIDVAIAIRIGAALLQQRTP